MVNAHDGPPRVNRRVVVNIINKSLGRVRRCLTNFHHLTGHYPPLRYATPRVRWP